MQKLVGGARELGLELSEEQLSLFQTYFNELVAWNSQFNLTGITDYNEVQIRHFLDSLTIIRAMGNESELAGKSVIDIGSGAGLPGIPLKIAIPGLKTVLLEATKKKAGFLAHIIGVLGLRDVEVINGRAEETAHDTRYRKSYDFVVSRAVAEMPVLLEFMMPFCRVGGLCIAPKKGDIKEELAASGKALSVLGGRLEAVEKVIVSPLADGRCLVVVRKIDNTPERYPRRPGQPSKNPLGKRKKV